MDFQSVSLFYIILLEDNDLVEVVGRGYSRVLFPQFNGQLRVSFQADAPLLFWQVKKGEHFAS